MSKPTDQFAAGRRAGLLEARDEAIVQANIHDKSCMEHSTKGNHLAAAIEAYQKAALWELVGAIDKLVAEGDQG